MSNLDSAVSTAAGIRPYEVVDSGKSVDDVLAYINETVFTAHGPDTRARGGVIGVLADPVFQYERLMRDLVSIDGFVGLPFCELLARQPGPGERFCGIRHDIDIDVRTAISLAEIERQYGVRSTWFVLHTAPYYGEFEDGIFKRHESMLHVYRTLQDLGHEIALHTDGLHVYQVQQADGAAAITTEIAWLRDNGIEIVGTTAHNSASVYGAENFAIFKGRPRSFSDRTAETRTEVTHNGRWAALGVLDESQLGLEYEANDLFWQDEVSVAYAATRGVNLWRWSSESSNGYHRRHKRPRTNGFVSYEELISKLRARSGGEYICLVVHPVYYGARHSPVSGPVLSMLQRAERQNPSLGWTTYAPGELRAEVGYVEGRQEFQSLNVADENGMLALPIDPAQDAAEPGILILGGRNVDGASCGIEGHAHSLVQRELSEGDGGPVRVIKCAHPDIGLARYYGWYQTMRDVVQSHTVVLALGADELADSLKANWTRKTGYNAKYPPGTYLAPDESGNIVMHARAASAEIHRARPQPDLFVPSLAADPSDDTKGGRTTDRAVLENIIVYFVDELKAAGKQVIFLIQECGESEQLWTSTAVANGSAERAHENFLSWLQPLADKLNVLIADPYAEFLNGDRAERMHWDSRPEWNYIGHRLAAKAIMGLPGPSLGRRALTDDADRKDASPQFP